MFWTILYYVSMILVFAGGGALIYAMHDEKDFYVKHLIGIIAVTLIVGIIPVINTIAIVFVIVVIIGSVIEDDSSDSWFNKPAFGKKEDKK